MSDERFLNNKTAYKKILLRISWFGPSNPVSKWPLFKVVFVNEVMGTE